MDKRRKGLLFNLRPVSHSEQPGASPGSSSYDEVSIWAWIVPDVCFDNSAVAIRRQISRHSQLPTSPIESSTKAKVNQFLFNLYASTKTCWLYTNPFLRLFACYPFQD